VLTAYVGIDGLLYQLSSDGCLPAVLMSKNSWRQTNHYIILVYLFLATSQVLLLEGDVDALAGVYR
jgi:amino acid transporter